jgi:hypothetical protein
MILKARYLLILILTVCSLFCVLSVKTLAFDPLGNSCNGNNVQGGNGNNSPVCEDNNKARGDGSTKNVVLRTLKTASDIVAFLAGVIAVIVIIISGLTMVISGGNNEQVANARRRIIYAAVGLGVVALAWTIISFVLKKVL